MPDLWTDGYITSDPDGNWEYSNVGGEGAGDGLDLTAPAWCRYRRFDDPLPGTRVTQWGEVQEGPAIRFDAAEKLLAEAGREDSTRPFIVWAGVSPMSLREALIVWNDDIVLLNKSGITGGEVVAVVGRLMIVHMEAPVSITGEEVFNVSIEPGAVGHYTKPDLNCVEDAPAGGGEDEQAPPWVLLGNVEEEPELEPLPEPVPFPGCLCIEVKLAAEGGDEDEEDEGEVPPAPDMVDAQVFCSRCSGGIPCADTSADEAGFALNNKLIVPVRCVDPFLLVELKVCRCREEAPTRLPNACEDACPVWLASAHVFGTTAPLQSIPLDRLKQINPCDVRYDLFQSGIPCVLLDDTICCAKPARVAIVGFDGPRVVVEGRYYGLDDTTGGMPGHAGQAARLYFQCQCDPCDKTVPPPCIDDPEQCTHVIYAEEAQCWVDEDIYKPMERVFPVSFFADMTLTSEEHTAYTTDYMSVVTSNLGTNIPTPTNIQDIVFEYPQAIDSVNLTIPTAVLDTAVTYIIPHTGPITAPTQVKTEVVAVGVGVETSAQTLVTSVNTTVEPVITEVGTTVEPIITSVSTTIEPIITSVTLSVENMVTSVDLVTSNVVTDVNLASEYMPTEVVLQQVPFLPTRIDSLPVGNIVTSVSSDLGQAITAQTYTPTQELYGPTAAGDYAWLSGAEGVPLNEINVLASPTPTNPTLVATLLSGGLAETITNWDLVDSVISVPLQDLAVAQYWVTDVDYGVAPAITQLNEAVVTVPEVGAGQAFVTDVGISGVELPTAVSTEFVTAVSGVGSLVSTYGTTDLPIPFSTSTDLTYINGAFGGGEFVQYLTHRNVSIQNVTSVATAGALYDAPQAGGGSIPYVADLAGLGVVTAISGEGALVTDVGISGVELPTAVSTEFVTAVSGVGSLVSTFHTFEIPAISDTVVWDYFLSPSSYTFVETLFTDGQTLMSVTDTDVVTVFTTAGPGATEFVYIQTATETVVTINGTVHSFLGDPVYNTLYTAQCEVLKGTGEFFEFITGGFEGEFSVASQSYEVFARDGFISLPVVSDIELNPVTEIVNTLLLPQFGPAVDVVTSVGTATPTPVEIQTMTGVVSSNLYTAGVEVPQGPVANEWVIDDYGLGELYTTTVSLLWAAVDEYFTVDAVTDITLNPVNEIVNTLLLPQFGPAVDVVTSVGTVEAASQVLTVPVDIQTSNINVVTSVGSVVVDYTPIEYASIDYSETFEVLDRVDDTFITYIDPASFTAAQALALNEEGPLTAVFGDVVGVEQLPPLTLLSDVQDVQVVTGVAASSMQVDNLPTNIAGIDNAELPQTVRGSTITYVDNVDSANLVYPQAVHSAPMTYADGADVVDSVVPVTATAHNYVLPTDATQVDNTRPLDAETTVQDIPTNVVTQPFTLVTEVGTSVFNVVTSVTEVVKVQPLDIQTQIVNLPTGVTLATATAHKFDVVPQFVLTDSEGADIDFPVSESTYETLKVGEGDITILTSTEPGCGAKYKFLNHDGTPWKYTESFRGVVDCCDGEQGCLEVVLDHPTEVNCQNALVFAGHYIVHTRYSDDPGDDSVGSAEKCPCFTCDPEPGCTDPEGNHLSVRQLGGGRVKPCTIRVKRLQRDLCKYCK